MVKTRVFEILEERGQKQRWLVGRHRATGLPHQRGLPLTDKGRRKTARPEFREAASKALGMPEHELFTEGAESKECQQRTVKKKTRNVTSRREEREGQDQRRHYRRRQLRLVARAGAYYYKDAEARQIIPGIMHTNLGGYHISDINFVAAIDIDANKVGKDLSEAIFAAPEQHLQVQRRAQARASGSRAA